MWLCTPFYIFVIFYSIISRMNSNPKLFQFQIICSFLLVWTPLGLDKKLASPTEPIFSTSTKRRREQIRFLVRCKKRNSAEWNKSMSMSMSTTVICSKSLLISYSHTRTLTSYFLWARTFVHIKNVTNLIAWAKLIRPININYKYKNE